MKLSLIIEAIDRATAPVSRVIASTKRLNSGLQQTTSVASAVSVAERKMFVSTPRRLDAVSKAIGKLVAGPRSMGVLEKAVGGVASSLGGLAGLGIASAIGTLTGLFGFLTYGVVSTAAKFELFLAQLESLDGSAEKARQSFAWVRKFAVDTPYQVDEVTEAFVRARKVGIDPYHGAFRDLGDAASSSNKTLLSAVEAVADAQNFEYERLREFNITSSTKGQAVTFQYLTKAGKEASVTVKKTKLDVQHAVLDIMRATSSGAMLLRSRTFTGIMANIQDTFTNFQFDVASAGFFEKVKGKLQVFLNWLNSIAGDGTLKRWAKQTSDLLSGIVDKAWAFAQRVNWGDVVKTLKLVGGAFWSITKLLARGVELVMKLDSLLRALPQPPKWAGGTTPDASLGGMAPPAWVRNTDRWLSEHARGLFGPSQPAASGPSRPMKPMNRSPAAPRAAPGNAQISLYVTTDRGASVRTTKLKAAGLDVGVNTPRAMAPFA